MCGTLLSKFITSGNEIEPTPRTGSLEPKRVPRKTKLIDKRTEVQVSSPVERISDQNEDFEIKASDSVRTCTEGSESESKAEERATEIESAKITVQPSADCPREAPSVYRPTIDINKVKEVVAKDMARLQKLEVEKIVEKFAKEKLMVKEKQEAIQGGPSSSSNTVVTKPISSTRSILLGKTKSAIAFEVLVGSKRKETVLLSARVPRRLRRHDNPPQLTAEVMSARQLAAQEKRLKELERVRNCARAYAQTGRRNDPVNDTLSSV
ncbi:hypothetical protein ACROYT_G005790 [Oculina patagonica]